MKKAIVTGATGFIGSWLVDELLENGYSVTLIVRNKERLLSRFIENCFVIENAVQGNQIYDFPKEHTDVLFHLAWEGVSSEEKNDIDIQIENIKMSLNVMSAAHESGCDLFVSAGTVAEYALCDNVMDLAARQTPDDFYGAAKASVYYFLEVKARQLELPFIWCVIPSTYGERRSDSNIITYTIKSLLQGQKPIYGNLAQMWEFLYVKDVVRALRLIGEQGKKGKVYGIGSGEYKMLQDYIYRIRDVINMALPLGIGESLVYSDRTFSSCVNNYDLKKDTGFQPEYTFEEGITRTIEYYRKQIEQAHS